MSRCDTQESAVLIFAKEPVPGRVKTRLSPPFSPEEAAAVYAESLRETVVRMQRGFGRVLLAVAGNHDPFLKSYPQVPVFSQQGDDLGEKMANALSFVFAAGVRKAVIVGTDTPDLPLQIVSDALSALEHADAVVAPAADGGYVLIGAKGQTPGLFAGVSWSTPEVLTQTRALARRNRVSLAEVDGWDDLDDLAALRRLIHRSPGSSTAEYLLRSFPHHLGDTGLDRS